MILKKDFLLNLNGPVDKSKLVDYVAIVLEEMTLRYENLYNKDIASLYFKKIDFILKEYKNFKVR